MECRSPSYCATMSAEISAIDTLRDKVAGRWPAIYLRDLNLADPQIQLILSKIDRDKSFDVPNILLPKPHAIAYER